MGKLIYGTNTSLDGCTEDSAGAFAWAPPDDEVFAAVTELMGSAGTYLYGRRMYETLAVWETDPSLGGHSDLHHSYARTWQAAEKVVYSTTLDEPSTERTRIERSFDPDAVRMLKSERDHDLLVGGPHLAATALGAGLVDEVLLYVWPMMLGGRNRALPSDVACDLTLLDERRFANGVVYLRYAVT